MSVITDDTIQIPIDLVGGLWTLADPMNNPPGASPNCQDADFLPGVPGTVQTRPGLFDQHQFPNNPTINHACTFVDQQQNHRNLYFDSLQNLWQEFPQNTFNIIGTIYQSKYVKTDTAFGREWIAFSDGKFGTDAPRQWDGTNLDRVSQDGSGTPPTAVDQVATIAVSSAVQEGTANITEIFELVPNLDLAFTASNLHRAVGTTISVAGVAAGGYNGTFVAPGTYVPGTGFLTNEFEYQNPTTPLPTEGPGGTVASSYATIQTATPHELKVGQSVIIAGVGGGYNGTWLVEAVPDATHFTFFTSATGLGPLGAGGTIQLSGVVSAGIHQVTVLYVTRQGYFTRPAPPFSWTAGGGKRVQVSNIPIGPANVIARIICFTAAGAANFYYIPTNFIAVAGVTPPTTTIINDNTTTTATFDFSDTALLSSISTNVDDLFDNLTLGEVAGFFQYANRIFAWGERAKLNNLLNPSFDGGSIAGVPTGWIPTGTVAGALDAANSTVPGLAGYRITGDGATAKVGAIQQGAAQDYLGVPIIQPNTAYSVRFRLLIGGGIAAGTFHINLSSVLGGGIQGTDSAVAFNNPSLSATFFEFILPLTTAATFPTTVFSDLLLNVYADGTPTNNGFFTVDDIQVFPTLAPYNVSLVRASFAADPETFQGTTGFLQISANDDLRVTCLYTIRETLRIAKEHSLFTTTNDPTSEPNDWDTPCLSSLAGSATIRSAGAKIGEKGKDWVALLCRDGLFIDYGQQVPEKLNQEVQRSNGVSPFAFDLVNWAAAHTAWITYDTQRRRMLVGLPMGAAIVPSVVAAMDFKAPRLGDPATLAQTPLVAMSTFTNKQVALSGARKWCPWSIVANCGGMIERSDGTAHLFIGNGAGNGKLYDLLPTQTTDDGATIPFFFQASYLPDDDRKNIAFKFQGGLVLAKYLRAYIRGSGKLSVSFIGTGGLVGPVIPLTTAPAIVLANPPIEDIESMVEFRSERISVLVQAIGAGSWMSMQKLELFLEQDPVNALRGSN